MDSLVPTLGLANLGLGMTLAGLVDMKASLTALVLAVAGTSLCVGAESPIEEFPFDFREGLVWVKATLDQTAEPLSLLLDSGAAISVLDLEAARRLGVARGQPVAVRGVGTQAAGYWPQRLAAHLDKLALPREWLAVDLRCLCQACDHRLDGLLGADFFRGRVVQLDFASQKLRLLAHSEVAGAAQVLPIRFRRGAMRVPVSVNGSRNQWLRLDTGCATALQWVSPLARSESGPHRLSIGLAGMDIAMMTAKVELGRTCFDSVPIGLHPSAIFRGEAGLLGNGLLARFRVTVDAPKGRLILEEKDRP